MDRASPSSYSASADRKAASLNANVSSFRLAPDLCRRPHAFYGSQRHLAFKHFFAQGTQFQGRPNTFVTAGNCKASAEIAWYTAAVRGRFFCGQALETGDRRNLQFSAIVDLGRCKACPGWNRERALSTQKLSASYIVRLQTKGEGRSGHGHQK